MAQTRATEDEWRVYYHRAAEIRGVTGDPFKRHMERRRFRERLLMIGSALLVVALTSVSYLLTTR